jgi:hypothetical protein
VIDIQNILDNVASHIMATGYFDAVLGYESKQSPSTGLSAALYVEDLRPIRSSGLANTSVRLELELRLYSSTYQEPYEGIDTTLVRATDAVFTAVIGDFDLGSEARHVDIFGAHGQSVRVRSGYINLSGAEFRVFQVTVPVIIDDCWPQSA